jgi:hypothetical protein
MSGFVEWMGAQADDGEEGSGSGVPPVADESKSALPKECLASSPRWQVLPAHSFPWQNGGEATLQQESPLDRNPDLWLYRERTVGLLRRYMRFSLETGRLPSLVGREFFRAKITFYRAVTFEDRIIFVRDVEACLNRLAKLDQELIARVILQEHSQDDAASILHCSRRTIQRRVPEVIDLVSEEFLRVGLLTVLPPKRRETQ